ncbi:MAG TPA: hypothetical protein VFL28_07340 [bacterium]|nr:hypothetical protein [bacterium]
MALIEARKKERAKAVSVRLAESTLALVDAYAERLGGEERGYVIEQLLLYALRQDKDFAAEHGMAAVRRTRQAMEV